MCKWASHSTAVQFCSPPSQGGILNTQTPCGPAVQPVQQAETQRAWVVYPVEERQRGMQLLSQKCLLGGRGAPHLKRQCWHKFKWLWIVQSGNLDEKRDPASDFVVQWGKESKLLPDCSLLCLWKHKCVSGVSRQGRLGLQENTGFWNGKKWTHFQVEKSFPKGFCSIRSALHTGPWDKQCVAHSFALCCSVLHAPISVSMFLANDVPAVRWLLFSWCTPSLLF